MLQPHGVSASYAESDTNLEVSDKSMGENIS